MQNVSISEKKKRDKRMSYFSCHTTPQDSLGDLSINKVEVNFIERGGRGDVNH